MVGQANVVLLDAVAGIGMESEPIARLKIEIGIEIAEVALVPPRVDSKIGENVPIDNVDIPFPFGLKLVSKPKANRVLGIDGID